MVRRTGRIFFHKTAEMTIAEECPVSSSRARLNGFELQLTNRLFGRGPLLAARAARPPGGALPHLAPSAEDRFLGLPPVHRIDLEGRLWDRNRPY